MITFEDYINETLIQFPRGGTKKYNQVVFMGGGMASGKGFALSNFLDSSSFKVFDVDALKKSIMKLSKLGFFSMKEKQEGVLEILPKKYHDTYIKLADAGKIFDDLELSNSEHATILHFTQRYLKLNDRLLGLITAANSGSGNKPNLLFDMAAKKGDIVKISAFLDKAGYLPEDRHLVWVLTGIDEALVNNLSRERIAPEEDVIKYHKIVAENIIKMVKSNDWRGINGDAYVVLNNRKLTRIVDKSKFKTPVKGKFKSKDKLLKARLKRNKKLAKKGNAFYIAKKQGFQYIHLKKKGSSSINAGVVKKFWDWVAKNTPK